MSTNKFVIKLIMKGFILICMIFLAKFVFPSYSTIFTNEVALSQMQNSDSLYIFMNTYTKIIPLAKFIYSCVMVWITATIGFDTYKFVKSNEHTNNMKEN